MVRLQQALGNEVQFMGVSWDRFQPFDGRRQPNRPFKA